MSTTPSEPPRGHPTRARELIAELAAGGELIDEGAFTVDANEARTKLRRYGLADPRAYACLLVEVGVLCDARRIHVEPELFSLMLRFEFGGASFAAAELEQLFSALFIDIAEATHETERRRRRALQQLAIAVNTVFSLGAVSVSISSYDQTGAGGRIRLHSRDGGESVSVDPFESGAGKHRRCVVDVRFARSQLGQRLRRPERRVLLERCRFTKYAISLAGKPLSQGPQAALESAGRIFLAAPIEIVDDAGEVIGLAARLPADVGAARLELLVNGWLCERFTLIDHDEGFVACVEVDLPRDLSHSRIVRNAAFRSVMAAVRRAHDQVREPELGSTLVPVERSETRPTKRRVDLMSISSGRLAALAVFGTLGACGLVTASVVQPGAAGLVALAAAFVAVVVLVTRN